LQSTISELFPLFIASFCKPLVFKVHKELPGRFYKQEKQNGFRKSFHFTLGWGVWVHEIVPFKFY
jgi:hypothetical protein